MGTILNKQTAINKEMSLIRKELQVIKSKLGLLEKELLEVFSHGELSQYRHTLDRITPLANLIFHLEIRLVESSTSESFSGEALKSQMEEANKLKSKEDERLQNVLQKVRE